MSEPSSDAALIKFIDPDQLKADLAFNLTDLSSAMQTHAALYVHYATMAVRARAQSDRWKTAVEVLDSQLDQQARKQAAAEGAKITEPMVRAAVVNDPRYKAASARMIEAQAQFRLAEAAERAFEHRKDMLLQIARNQAKEMDGSLRVVHNVDVRQRALESMRNAAGAGAA